MILEQQEEGREPHGLRFIGPGLVVGNERFARAFDAVEDFARSWTRLLGGSRVRSTGTLTTDTVHAAGYFANFPQHVFTKSPYLQEGTEQPPVGYATSPAACLCIYEALRDSSLESRVTYGLTANCGRYEAGSWEDPLRLASFNAFEVVSLGPREQTIDHFHRCRDLLERIAERFPGATVPVATDAFFGPAAAQKQAYQERVKVKYELEATLTDGRSVSIGSVNSHGQVFGKGFGITTPDGPAFSACFAIGLERFTIACMDAFGDDPESWPDLGLGKEDIS
ncbi:class-II aminoacyl-tRNA synthetase family protein [Nocardiopsis kunsanensis]|uniref:Aminoacyl-transfer RNA synthetases class-II family profile domain-containing protein n=1 Tax=Nocardiopsis kunsanensis TaxID=141693 RepID=A0A919CMC4_9ACTN|nr:hypothetical protein [Nocardiopsis kunsanensis]GHD35702.1 hypothetical protein GCM10007147_42390 [Nocardiopsis kunsanensis]